MLNRTSVRQSICQFYRQMAVLSNAGIALERALEICASQTSCIPLRSKALRISEDIRHGVRLSDAMSGAGAPFTALHSGVVVAAEATGRYDDAFEQLALWEEKADRVERKIRSLMNYPMLVCAVAIVGTFVLMRFLAPLVTSVMEQIGGEPTLPTAFIMWVGNIGCSPALMVVLAIGIPLLVWGARRLLRNGSVRLWWERWSLSVPIVGSMLWKAWMVRVARCLHALISAGLPMVRCIELTADATGNAFLGEYVLRDAALGVQKGETLSQALPREMVSRAFMGMLSVGESTGAVAEMLERVADLHEVELASEIDGLFRATEPLVMGAVGVMVLICLICAFQPLYTMAMRF